MHRRQIAGPSRDARDEHRPLAGAPADDPSGLAGALQPAIHPWAIVSAGLAPILLTGGYLVAGTLQPASYSPVRTTISVMAGQAGTDRWVMTGGIFLVGGCYLITAAGLTGIRVAARALLIVAGLACIGIAASPNPPAARPRGTSPGPCSARSRSPYGPPSPPGAPHRGR